MKKVTTYMIRFISATVLILLVGCNGQHTVSNSNPPKDALDTVPVFRLEDRRFTKNTQLTAELLPDERTEIFARVQGYIKDIKIDIGDKVRKGQILAVIEAPELQAKFAEYISSMEAAKAKYMSSQDVYQRLQKASEAKTAGIVAPVDLERSRNQFLADSASFMAAGRLTESHKLTAGYMVLHAPFDGTITARNADRGALVGNNQMLLTLQNNTRLRLRIAVPELYVAASPQSKQVNFTVDAYPEKTFQASLVRKSGVIDAATRTELWEYEVDNKNNLLKAGSFAYVNIEFQRSANSFVVVPGSITTTQERRFVIRVKNGKAEWVDVRQGISTNEGVEIFGDLSNGDTLLVRATDERKPGTVAHWVVKK